MICFVVLLTILSSDHNVYIYITAAMLLQIFRRPCCLVAWSDFFAGIAILGRFLAQPDSPGFTGFSFSLSLSPSCPPLREKENPANPGLSG